jgi:hypothetical protein
MSFASPALLLNLCNEEPSNIEQKAGRPIEAPKPDTRFKLVLRERAKDLPETAAVNA